MANQIILSIILSAIAGLVGYYLGSYFRKKSGLTETLIKDIDSESAVLKERIMSVRNHTMRLTELAILKKRVDEFDGDSAVIDKSINRLEEILNTLELAIKSDNEKWADLLLTRFSKHLRQLLHEGASSRIEIDETCDHLESSLSLLSAMNQNTWAYEINTDRLNGFDKGRTIKSMSITPWVLETLWDCTKTSTISKTVNLEIISDTYEVLFLLKVNGKTYERKEEI
ncbi:MAG: hypothetical protein COA49_01680 [Bacteroidetes bacterium]|nr:MAG: hypothetical protein COA49_01680 [Bacteroidota bacterium]